MLVYCVKRKICARERVVYARDRFVLRGRFVLG